MIYTIGYSTRSLPEFIAELEKRSITQLCDVRSSPWSRNAAFNVNQIERWSEAAGIMYRRCGDVLGGRADIPLDDPAYVASLDQIVDASLREHVAIMCAEGDPADCHRTWDIGATLLITKGVEVTSILRNGLDEEIADTIRRVRPSRFRSEVRLRLGGGDTLF